VSSRLIFGIGIPAFTDLPPRAVTMVYQPNYRFKRHFLIFESTPVIEFGQNIFEDIPFLMRILTNRFQVIIIVPETFFRARDSE
jgi:hypothetical protein